MEANIGLDISGGDYAPAEVFKGAVLAQREFGCQVTLIGVLAEIEQEAAKFPGSLKQFKIIDAPEKITMDDSPATAVRRKKNSSMALGMNLLKDRKIDAFVSCGNTGGMVCAATLTLGLIPGVERPGIATAFPTKKGTSLIIDVGANIDPKPLHMLQYGVMASVYSSLVLGVKKPTIGLLNIGEEASKGSLFVKNVHKLFSSSNINFVGNVEAKDLFSGECDCVVSDGVMGNIALKVSEGCAEFMVKSFVAATQKNILGKLGLLMLLEGLKDFRKKIDYAEYGGAPLLGVDGIVIIGHGRSKSLAVKNAVRVATKEVKHDLNANIKNQVEEICNQESIRKVLETQTI